VGKEGCEGGEDWRSAEVQRLGMEVRPRTWLVPVILLSLRECSSYGYELMERASAFGFEAVNPGTLYRTLRQMEKDGLCESEWDTNNGGGPARRMYSINDTGEEYLGFWAESLDQYRQKMDAFLRLYTGGQSLTDQEKDVG
jgi:PadR family transcriptional regulator, regulatory protein PadR